MRMLSILALSLLLPCTASVARDAPLAVPPSGVLGVSDAELTPDYWVARAPDAEDVLLSSAAIAAQNARVLARDDSMHDLAALPRQLPRATVRGWIEALSRRPSRTLYDSKGNPIDAATLDALMASLALDAIATTQATRYGLIVHRAALRSFPTDLRVFREPGDTDIDRFQESGIFPGTPVVIAHTSRDGQWLFVVSPRYAAWIKHDAVAAGTRELVLGYGQRSPYRIITGAQLRTVFTPEQPSLSQRELDMGVRIPLARGLDPAQPVNGQTAYAAWTLDLPLRQADGSLALAPALLQKNTDSAADYLPLNRANIIRQAFKFLGERYGWGHDYNGRDCSGFVSDVYRSMGVVMPRNTSDQAVSPAFEHRAFTASSSKAERLAAVARLDIGDLVYIPGHVLMVIGTAHGRHYMIHDVGGMSYVLPDGSRHHVKLNSVAVTPLEPMMYNQTESYIDRMTSIVHVHGRATP
ncbi:MAG TPA: SH3 domain-containing protein [Rhodanobacteraceae bacterium]|nr:SH3 domain-containing protein [Rhodanobacteraceae bacterium]